ncbi:MAG: VCBS repeat-containing protein [Chloracidobacterium sp.]|nr:VCBS repeat-containing protein [Chloracidobacterium sp.]
MKLRLWMLVLLVVVGSLPVVAATNFTQRQKITSTPRGVGAQFGNAVAISGNTMVVGARYDSTTASQAGAAYIYIMSGGIWTQQAVLLAPDGSVADKFGYSVAISTDTIIVGAFNDDSPQSNAGSAYVYVRSGTTWSFQQKLTAIDAAADDQFGIAVAVIGTNAFVGANFADQPSNSDAGAVYRYTQSGAVWSHAQKLIPAGGVILGDHFGESLALSGNKLIIGSPGADVPFTAAGSVYVYIESGGIYAQQDKISIATGANGDSFGNSVAVDGNTLIGGALQYTPTIGQPAFGAAYVFKFNGSSWISEGRLTASDGATVDRFGYSVAVSGDIVAVGAREDDTIAGGPDAGSAYIFKRVGSSWTEKQKLAPSDPFNGDRFGYAVALQAEGLIVGAAEKALTSPNGQGAAYYFAASSTFFDYDGDAKADISIFRPSNGQWWYQKSSDNSVAALTFGSSTDKPIPADYDGDGKTDIAIYRPSTGEWFILRSSNLSFYAVPFGISSDNPVPGDYDGDGFADIAVFRASTGTWYINRSSGGIIITQWGGPGDVPVNADYDGDGKTDPAIYRPASGEWWINRSTTGLYATSFGISTDKPVTADYTGDGKSDIAIWRPSNGNWYILRSEDQSFYTVPFGASGDIPVTGDYDGDGKADISIFRPSGANWFILRSTSGILIQQFGGAGDVPTPASFVP